ncbi:MAG: ATP-dependent Clp protease adaptor ClpS [Fibrobacteria bacterium]|nr:ATP-dependent Clp protease adaptor ClpS [Fibrobacteria bacterium]
MDTSKNNEQKIKAINLDTAVRQNTNDKPDTRFSLGPQCKLTLHNDNVNYTFHVTKALCRVLHSPEQAKTVMLEAHTSGRAVICSGNREKLECYAVLLKGNNLKVSVE